MMESIKWPCRQKVARYYWIMTWLHILFILVYGGTNWAGSQRKSLYHFFFNWELNLPFVPWMIYIYFSIILLFSLPLFAFNIEELKILALRMIYSLLIGGVIFLAFPGQLGFDRPQQVPGYNPIFQLLHLLDQPHNLLPSLHITFSALIILALVNVSPFWVQLIWYFWLALICISVVLVHQHHIADVGGGLLLAWCLRMRSDSFKIYCPKK
tara:strand:- start:11 stop:643 length:633 start_codon:yes stop_codon:yes gene_type:complete